MDAAKPDLADVLARIRISPEVVLVIAAALVNGDRVAADVDDGIPAEKGKLHRIVNPAVGTDRVPHAAEFDADGPGMGKLPFESFVRFKGFPRALRLPRTVRIHV